MTTETENPSTLVNSSSNPYSALLREFKEHTIDRETFYTALFTMALSDTDCDFKCKPGPEKPYQLRDSERKMLESCSAMEDKSEAWKMKVKFYGQARERFKEFFTALDETKARNLSNKIFLNEIREFFHQRQNDVLVETVNEILRTYER